MSNQRWVRGPDALTRECAVGPGRGAGSGRSPQAARVSAAARAAAAHHAARQVPTVCSTSTSRPDRAIPAGS
ncbi:hypothetical protein SHL15_6656 [Streptomyces hygroscopicus subsp. limoneus]|nr:hypothetical protein SHL15_6656 [Streptomyces hygroscopicus subsp. limoneus]